MAEVTQVKLFWGAITEELIEIFEEEDMDGNPGYSFDTIVLDGRGKRLESVTLYNDYDIDDSLRRIFSHIFKGKNEEKKYILCSFVSDVVQELQVVSFDHSSGLRYLPTIRVVDHEMQRMLVVGERGVSARVLKQDMEFETNMRIAIDIYSRYECRQKEY